MVAQTRKNQRNDSGFTLVEAMITIVILAVLSALAIPAVQTALRSHAINSATQQVMHLVDFARIQAMSRNRAYRLVVSRTSGANGQMWVDESTNTRCSGFATTGVNKIRTLNFNQGDLITARIIGTVPVGFGDVFHLCFTPNGRVLQTDTGRPVPSGNAEYGAGDAIIVIQRVGLNSSGQGTPTGIQHQIVVPYNGIPRFVAGAPTT
jgi:prepilin-type N-terminal cleavage/methylation domain-containing protein